MYSQMLDVPKECDGMLREWRDNGSTEHLPRLLEYAKPRSCGDTNEGIILTYTAYYQMIRGYDEFYIEWGSEDIDLQRRFAFLGLEIQSVKDDTYYMHQWHEKFASLNHDDVVAADIRNQKYLWSNTSIVRNDQNWGLPRVEPTIAIKAEDAVA